MPKQISITVGAAVKRWEIVGYRVAASETDTNVGSLAIDVRETLLVDDAEVTSRTIQVSGNNAQLRAFFADAAQRIGQLLQGGTGSTAAYAIGTREALYAALKAIATIPTEAA